MCDQKMVRLCFSIKIQTKLKLVIVNFFLVIRQTNYGEKKCVVSMVIGFGFFYILTYYFYQILDNAPLIVKIHHKKTLFLSTLTKQYSFFCNFYPYFIYVSYTFL